jgi:hypothetical protein
MKYLGCSNCQDVFNLKLVPKKCSCGITEGMYINNEEAIYSGENAVCLALHNQWVQQACRYREEHYHFGNRVFIGWTVPDNTANFTKVDSVTKEWERMQNDQTRE